MGRNILSCRGWQSSSYPHSFSCLCNSTVGNRKVALLIQASADQSAQMKTIAAVIESQDWHRVPVVYEDIPSSTGAILQLSEALKDVGIEIGHLLPLPPLSSSSSLVEELHSLKEGQCRVFVVHTSLQLGVHLFETAKKMEMRGKKGMHGSLQTPFPVLSIP